MFLNAFVRTASMMLRIKLTLFFWPVSSCSQANLECFSVLLILMRDGRSGQGTLLDVFTMTEDADPRLTLSALILMRQ